jgi:hypothetical protein
MGANIAKIATKAEAHFARCVRLLFMLGCPVSARIRFGGGPFFCTWRRTASAATRRRLSGNASISVHRAAATYARRAAFLCIVPLVMLLFGTPRAAQGEGEFAGERIAEWSLPGLPEPSSVVYHARRNTLFVVSDEGAIGEVTLDGKVLSTRAIGGDLEGITTDPGTGYLYIVREGHEIIFELDAATFSIRRRFTIDRTFEGDPDFLERGGDGIEGLTFVPDGAHPEGGRFYAVNQFDPPVLVELALPLRTTSERFEKARIVAAYRVGSPPLSDVVWSRDLSVFLIPSALWRSVHVVDAQGRSLRTVRVPGIMQEGLALLPDGGVVIAQDTGGLIKWYPASSPFDPKGSARVKRDVDGSNESKENN